MASETVVPFKNAVEDNIRRARRMAAQGKKFLGYFCTYTPVEVIHAAGFVPLRLSGRARTVVKADGLVPNFICPFLRRSLEDALNGEYDFISGVVQGYTCDAACGMVNIWKENVGGELFHSLPLPYNDNASARRFFRSVILEFAEKLQRSGGRFSEAALSDSLDLYAQIRRHMMSLYQLRHSGRLPLSASEFLLVVEAGFQMPPEEYLGELERLGAALKRETPPAGGGIPVLVSGSLVEDGAVLDILEASGGRVAADDLCTGHRHFHPPDGTGAGPLDRLIDRTMKRAPCPARSRAVDRGPYLMDLIRQSGAVGVVFLVEKFCTPHLADLPILDETLKKEGVPGMVFEMEETGAMEGQLRTRLESFFEMIGGAYG